MIIEALSTFRQIVRTLKPKVQLQCTFCYYVRDRPSPAILVMNGQSVCYDHSYYTQGGEFTKILSLVKRDEKAK